MILWRYKMKPMKHVASYTLAIFLAVSSTAQAQFADSDKVYRGGTCTGERFTAGTGVTTGADGKLSGVSVNVAPASKSLADATVGINNGKVGVSTVSAVKSAGGTLTPKPRTGNPYHAEISGITAATGEKLFASTLVKNPNAC
jgi:hypothetical protein